MSNWKEDLTPSAVFKIAELKVCPAYVNGMDGYQRSETITVKKIVSNGWNPELAGVITVSIRPDGDKYIVDGFQRTTAAEKIGVRRIRGTPVYFKGSEEEIIAQEAALFAKLNSDRTNVKSCYIHNSLLLAGDEKTKALNDMLELHGYSIGPSAKYKVFSGSKSLLPMMNKPEIFGYSLDMLTRLTMPQNHPTNTLLIRGLFELIGRMGIEKFDENEWIQDRIMNLGPEEIVKNARNYKRFRNSGSSCAAGEALLELINYRVLSENKIRVRFD